jgi:hypothetical protein
MRGWRRYPAFYLLALFVGAAVAPHHHLDPIADLLSDRPSNSGTFAQVQGPGGLDEGAYPGRMVQDESCFACFHSDFVASFAVALSLTHALEPLAEFRAPSAPTALSTFSSHPSSRGPPSAS